MKNFWRSIKCFFGAHPKDNQTHLGSEQRLLHTGFRISWRCEHCRREYTRKTGGKMWAN